MLEFDPAPTAVIEPRDWRPPVEGIPRRAVVCFFQEVIAQTCQGSRVITELKAEHGAHPVYVLEHEGQELAVFHPGVGAPLAAAFLEEAIAAGIRTFVACGSSGALVPALTLGHVVVPTSAVRDEGTSYHYLPAAREVSPTPSAVAAIEAALKRRAVPYVTGKTWTTDGVYRETRAKVERRVAEGCLTVEMEAAAFFAVAQFRGATFGQLLYAGDDLSGREWEHRGFTEHASGREQLFRIAVEACLAL
ncbi:MAG: nucleoside phosphorylase [Actinobacteria bacterium]|nr:nucleoside phosphorylase [Actinomycetota bacterium]